MNEQNLQRIPSFAIDHDEMDKGLYKNIQRHGVTTWDLRFKTPNGGDYITPKALHSIEHILATLLRNSAEKNNIVYFGPMGCRTGFYLLTTDLEFYAVKRLLIECFEKVDEFTTVPGSEKKECGNYLEHDLDAAKTECRAYLRVLKELS